ncbi:MAG: hypothetical protein U0525_03845 [Patescibacteria group bacterium]
MAKEQRLLTEPILEGTNGMVVGFRGGVFSSMPKSIQQLEKYNGESSDIQIERWSENPLLAVFDGCVAAYAPYFRQIKETILQGGVALIDKPPRKSNRHLNIDYSLTEYLIRTTNIPNIFVNDIEARSTEPKSYDIPKADVQLVYGQTSKQRRALIDNALQRWGSHAKVITLPRYISPHTTSEVCSALGWTVDDIAFIKGQDARWLRDLDVFIQFLGNNARLGRHPQNTLPPTLDGLADSLSRHISNLIDGQYGESSDIMLDSLAALDRHLTETRKRSLHLERIAEGELRKNKHFN